MAIFFSHYIKFCMICDALTEMLVFYIQPVPEKLLLEEDTLLGDRVRYIKEWTRFYAILCSEFWSITNGVLLSPSTNGVLLSPWSTQMVSSSLHDQLKQCPPLSMINSIFYLISCWWEEDTVSWWWEEDTIFT